MAKELGLARKVVFERAMRIEMILREVGENPYAVWPHGSQTARENLARRLEHGISTSPFEHFVNEPNLPIQRGRSRPGLGTKHVARSRQRRGRRKRGVQDGKQPPRGGRFSIGPRHTHVSRASEPRGQRWIVPIDFAYQISPSAQDWA